MRQICIFLLAAAMLLLAACGGTGAAGVTATPEPSGAVADSGAQSTGPVTTAGELHGLTAEYKDSDLDESWDDSAVSILCSGDAAQIDGEGAAASQGRIAITQPGTYVLSGDFQGQIAVEVTKTEKVHLILNGLTLTGDMAPLYLIQADKVTVTLAEGTENSVADTENYSFAAGEDEPDAAVFAKCDLSFNGSGSLTVTGNYACGIRCKDDLKILSGSYAVTAVKDCIKGKDSLVIRDGDFNLISGQDALKSSNDSEADKGYVIIDGGSFVIQAGDDAVHAETWLSLHGGDFDIRSCTEGLEGQRIDIDGGSYRIVATDDGVNAALAGSSTGEGFFGGMGGAQSGEEIYICIYGGDLHVTFAGTMGDCLDSNGSLDIYGGQVVLEGPNIAAYGQGESCVDADGAVTWHGGTLLAFGSVGGGMGGGRMGGSWSGCAALVNLDAAAEAGTAVTLTDASGTVLASAVPEERFSAVLAAADGMASGGSYTLTVGETDYAITATDGMTTVGEATAGMGGMGGGRFNGGAPEDFDPENLPEDFDPADLPEDFTPGDLPTGRPSGGKMPTEDNTLPTTQPQPGTEV